MTRVTNQVMRIRLRHIPLDEACMKAGTSRSQRRRISSATSAEMPRDQPSAMLKATTRTGLEYWAGEQVLNDGLKVRGLDIGLAPGAAVLAEVVDDEADILVVAAGDN